MNTVKVLVIIEQPNSKGTGVMTYTTEHSIEGTPEDERIIKEVVASLMLDPAEYVRDLQAKAENSF